ncbi:hypothetical protein BH24PSE2_BH24PSE2_07670 [soil metagenome]
MKRNGATTYMRNRQEILGAVFGDLEKKFERGVIEILCARDAPEPEALVAAIQEHTLRRLPQGKCKPALDAIDCMIDALELCYYHRDCTTFRSALERARALRSAPEASSSEPINLLPAAEVCQTEWRQRAQEAAVATEPQSEHSPPDSPPVVYPLRLRTVGRT